MQWFIPTEVPVAMKGSFPCAAAPVLVEVMNPPVTDPSSIDD